MIYSMTGFGAAARTWEQWAIRAEVRSVNHGEFKLSIRLADMFRLRETDLAAVVRERIGRGHVHLTVDCDLAAAALERLVDHDRLRAYLRAVREAASREGMAVSVEAGSVMGLPGVFSAEVLADQNAGALWKELVGTVRDALDGLMAMRRAEGNNLQAQLRDLCALIREQTREVERNAGRCVKDCKARLAARVEELLAGAPSPADADAIAREVAILAERSDVSEEITRLYSHLQQFATYLDKEGEAVGKALEFLVQEMQREANTMAAKLPAAELIQTAIEIKAGVQRLREQVRNVE
jgi:uncharacterized protein (TIGR00255 family)